MIFKSRKQIDITDSNELERIIIKNNPNMIINCAAFTNVDLSEKKKKISKKINSTAIKKFKEEDNTNPINYYGYTKLLAEEKIILSKLPSMIIRTSFLFSNKSKNFYTKILKITKKNNKLNIVDDIVSSPTNANDLSKAILAIINRKMHLKIKKPTIFHFANTGYCSRLQFVKFIKNNYKRDISIYPIKSSSYPKSQYALRPKYSILDNRKFQKFFKLKIRNWKTSLISELKSN